METCPSQLWIKVVPKSKFQLSLFEILYVRPPRYLYRQENVLKDIEVANYVKILGNNNFCL